MHAQFIEATSQILSCSTDEMVCLWNASSGELVERLSGHTDVVMGCSAYTVDGKGGKKSAVVVSCGDDQSCRVFNQSEGDNAGEGKKST